MARQALAFVTPALLAGILCGDAAPGLSLPGILGAPLACLLAVVLRRGTHVLAALSLGGFLAGAALPARWTAPGGASDLARLGCKAGGECSRPLDAVVRGRLAADPAAVAGGSRLLVDLSEITLAAGRRATSGRVLVYLGGPPPAARAGDRLRFRARLRPPGRYHNPGGVDRPRALARRGIRRVASIENPEEVAWLGGEARRSAPLSGARRPLRNLLRREAGDAAPLLDALLLGERGRIPPAVRDLYARAGVAHVLAVSGLHVAMVALAVGAALRAVLGLWPGLAAGGDAGRAGIAAGMLAAWGYALLAGAGEPALRAALMGSVLLGGALLFRRGAPWHGFWVAAACLAIGDPARLFEPAVQLSFLSVAGLLCCWSAWSGRRRRARAREPGMRALRWAVGTAGAAVVATLATLPVQATVFGRVSLAAPVANLVVLPLLGGLVLPLLLLAASLLPVSAGAAALLVRAAALLADAATAAASWFARATWSTLPLPPFTAAEAAAYYAVVSPLPFILSPARREGRPGRTAAALLAAGALSTATLASAHLWRLRPPEALRVQFLDVGQGDAALVETPGGARMVVDAGPAFQLPGGRRFDAGERVVGRTLRARWMRRIDVLAVTHPDADHAGGARAVLEGFRVGEVWIPSGAESARGLAPLLAAAARRQVPVRALARGEALDLGRETRAEVLAPARDRSRRAGTGPRAGWNDRSLVLLLRSPALRVLLAGDLEIGGERELLRAGADLRADVLKVGHHGSDTSSHAAFLAAVAPRVAVISAGPWNRFGFPAAATLGRLQAAGARVFRTDRRGAITVSGEAHGLRGADSRHSPPGRISVQWRRPIGRKEGRTGALFDRAPPGGRAGRGDLAPTGGGP